MSFDDLQWLEPLRQKTREIEAETERIRKENQQLREQKAMQALGRLYRDNDQAMMQLSKMKELPDPENLRIMWQVAVTSAIEGQGEPYEIFAKMLYWELTGTGPQVYLDVPITKEKYNASKNQSHPGNGN